MITYKLVPRVGCEIYRDGKLIEVHPIAGYTERLKELGYKLTKTPRYGWSATGKEITRRGAH